MTNPMGTDYGIINAEEVRGKGIEAELVTQANENLLLSAALGINDMTFENTLVLKETRCLSPSHTLNLAAQYNLQGGYYGRIEYRSVGDTFYDEENNAALLQEDYSVINAT